MHKLQLQVPRQSKKLIFTSSATRPLEATVTYTSSDPQSRFFLSSRSYTNFRNMDMLTQIPTSEQDVTVEFISKAMKDHLPKDSEIKDIKARCVTDSSDRDGFLSMIVKTKIFYVTNGKQEVVDVIVKMFPKGPEHRKMVREFRAYEREIHMYTNVLAAQREAQQDRKEILEAPVPKLYYHNRNMDFAVLVLEDLNASGFEMVPKRQGLNFDQAFLMVKELAKFHALNLNVKARVGVENYLYQNSLVLQTPLQVFEFMFQQYFPIIVETCKKMERPDLADHVDKYFLNKCKGNPFPRYMNALKPRGKMDCLTHGDSWSNNCLFKGNPTPTSAKLIDLQISIYSNITTDLVYVQYNSMSAATRKAHEPQLLQAYYDTLWNTLDALETPGLRKQDYTYEEFLKDVQISREYGFLISVVFIPTLLAPPGDLPDFDTLGEGAESQNAIMEDFLENRKAKVEQGVSPLVKERLIGMLEEMITYGVI